MTGEVGIVISGLRYIKVWVRRKYLPVPDLLDLPDATVTVTNGCQRGLKVLVVYRMPAAGKLSLEDSVPAATK